MSKPYFKVMTNITYPFFTKCFNWRAARPSKNCPSPGFFAELTGLIASNLNLTHQFIRMTDYLEQMPNKNSSADPDDTMIDELRHGRLDMFASLHDEIFSLYGKDFELSAPVYLSESRYVVARVDSRLSGMFTFFAVYDLPVWISLFATVALFLLTGCFVYWLSPNAGERRSFGKIIWQFVRLELMQYEHVREKILPLNALFFIFALLNCGIMIQMYNSLITSQAVRSVNQKPFKDNELFQVLKEGRYSLVFRSKTDPYYWAIKTYEELPYFEVRDTLEKYNNPIRFVEDIYGRNANVDMTDLLQSGRWITVANVETILLRKQLGFCNNVYIETGFPPRTVHLLFRKNHPLLSKINKIIVDEAINIRRIYNRYFNLEDRSTCKERATGPKALTLVPFCGILIIFGGGMVFASAAFLSELCVKRKSK